MSQNVRKKLIPHKDVDVITFSKVFKVLTPFMDAVQKFDK